MKKFKFEYDDDKLKLTLAAISIVLFLSIFFGIMYLNILSFFIAFLISVGVLVLFFSLNKKKIKKIGFVEIHNEIISFNLNGSEKIINFSDIENHTLNSFTNGMSLNLRLKKGKQFGIISNSYFSNPTNFIQFCYEFEKEINNYREEKNIKPVEIISFFDKNWVYPFLVFFSIVIIIILLTMVIIGNKNVVTFMGAIGSLITAWSIYFREKKR